MVFFRVESGSLFRFPLSRGDALFSNPHASNRDPGVQLPMRGSGSNRLSHGMCSRRQTRHMPRLRLAPFRAPARSRVAVAELGVVRRLRTSPQMIKPFRFLIASTALLSCFLGSALARFVPDWPYDKLLAESDLVAIVEPIENKPASDEYSGYGRPADHFDGTNTRFRVLVVLKPAGDAPKELTVLHFSYSKRVTVILNGACFVRFLIGPLQYEKRNLKDEKPVGGVTVFQEKPIWVAFLKRRPDGRFEPVTGHYDSAFSFRELHRASFFANP